MTNPRAGDGMTTEWRECLEWEEWGVGEARDEFRYCKALGLVFSREVCARCDRPALVEAVRAGGKYIALGNSDVGVAVCGVRCPDCEGGETCGLRELAEATTAALAALKQVKP